MTILIVTTIHINYKHTHHGLPCVKFLPLADVGHIQTPAKYTASFYKNSLYQHHPLCILSKQHTNFTNY